jgi:hypothetical protein
MVAGALDRSFGKNPWRFQRCDHLGGPQNSESSLFNLGAERVFGYPSVSGIIQLVEEI